MIKRVLVVDDFEPWRRYICSALRSNPRWHVVGEVADGLDAVLLAEALAPDVIVLDIGLPTMTGIEAARRILACHPAVQILFVTEQSHWDTAEAALGTGARGYVIKSDAGREFLQAMEQIVEGKLFVSERLAEDLVKRGNRHMRAEFAARSEKTVTPAWQIKGQYYETCSCDFMCPCLLGQMAVRPSKGSCTFAMAFKIDHGNYGAMSLDGLGFIVLGLTPGAMSKGNWSVGVVADERASVEQRDALTAIASGGVGGPMSVISAHVSTFLGVASAQICFERSGPKWSVTASSLVDMAAEGAMGINADATEPMHLSGTGHPANDRIALAHAVKSHVHAFGLTWDDASGKNNGYYAPFAWRSA